MRPRPTLFGIGLGTSTLPGLSSNMTATKSEKKQSSDSKSKKWLNDCSSNDQTPSIQTPKYIFKQANAFVLLVHGYCQLLLNKLFQLHLRLLTCIRSLPHHLVILKTLDSNLLRIMGCLLLRLVVGSIGQKLVFKRIVFKKFLRQITLVVSPLALLHGKFARIRTY